MATRKIPLRQQPAFKRLRELVRQTGQHDLLWCHRAGECVERLFPSEGGHRYGEGWMTEITTSLGRLENFANALWLYRQPGLPVSWKFVDAWRLLLKFAAYALYARPLRAHWRMMTRGLWDGLRGRLGRYRAQV